VPLNRCFLVHASASPARWPACRSTRQQLCALLFLDLSPARVPSKVMVFSLGPCAHRQALQDSRKGTVGVLRHR
jgi:hypothetical protein